VGQAALCPIRIDKPCGGPVDFVRSSAERAFFRCISEGIQDGLVVTSQPAESGPPLVHYANPAFAALAGIDPSDLDSLEGCAYKLSPHLWREHPLWRNLQESHRSEGLFFTDIVVRKENGRRTVLQLRSEPFTEPSSAAIHRTAVVRDITEQADFEEVFRRNERLAGIGLLAAGIAHEINNPTGSALLAAETALTMMDSPDAKPLVTACLRNIITSMDRCGRIVRTLLRYTREEPNEKQACSINDVAKQAIELARPYAERHGADLRLELYPEAPLAPMNPLEIELVLVNLVRNAIEAYEGKGDVISIQTGATEDGVRIVVTDNGCGMNEEQLAHVFDPLYTTRRQLGGSGLGMSIAHGIVQGHRGRMEVQSMPGMGTTITIDLPIAPGPLGPNGKGARSDHVPNSDRGG
jgi:signal transduction histidine kinase